MYLSLDGQQEQVKKKIRTTDTYLKRILSTNCCIHTVVPPDVGTTDTHIKGISTNCCIHTVVPPDVGTTDSHIKGIISTNCYIHTVVPPDDEPRYARNM